MPTKNPKIPPTTTIKRALNINGVGFALRISKKDNLNVFAWFTASINEKITPMINPAIEK